MRRCGALRAATLALLISAAANSAWAQAAAVRRPANAPLIAGVAQGLSTAAPSASQRLAAAMAQIRMAACAPIVQEVFDFLREGQPANFRLQPLGPDANRWPVVVVMESAHPTLGRTRFSTIIAAPGPGCSGMYEQTIYWAQPCADLKRAVFSTFQSPHPLLRNVQVSEANEGLQLYLTPGGAGCVSVKKELFH